MSEIPVCFDPALLSRLSSLALRARTVVEGLMAGIHRSRAKGFSVEFEEHREYAPGDDIRHLDWKALGRFDKYYIKEYREETNLRAYLLLDASASMEYAGNGISKWNYASTLVASLAYLLLRQGDAVGLLLFADSPRAMLPPQASRGHFLRIVEAIERLTPGGPTAVSGTLEDLAGQIHRRGMVILVSDLLDDQERLLKGLRFLLHRGHDVLVFQILDADEVDFPFTDLSRFEDPEDHAMVISDPPAVRREYHTLLTAFLARYREALRKDGVEYALLRTDTPLDRALVRVLAARGRRR